MEENILASEPSSSVCTNCNIRLIDPAYASPLCSDCREQFIKFPIPKWIKIFGGGVAVVLCFALVNLPSQLSIGLHLQKGKEAVKNHRYRTAERELKLAINKIPHSQEAQAYLMISSLHNMDFKEFESMYSKLTNQKFDDDDLFAQVQDALNDAEDYFPTDSLQAVINEYNGSIDSLPDTKLEEFVKRNPTDIFAGFTLAQRFSARDEYAKADTLLTRILKIDENYLPALQMICGLKRQEGDAAASIRYCNQIIDMDRENMYALSSKSRSLLKMHKDKEALDLAKKTIEIDKSDGYSQATLCLAYHFNGKTKERDELISQSKKDSLASYYFEYALDVINNKESFR